MPPEQGNERPAPNLPGMAASHPTDGLRAEPPPWARSPRSEVAPTSLVPPHLPEAAFSRPRLLDEVSAGVTRTLTLVSAPAGMGKTILVEDWARSGRAAGPVAWVSLSPADDDRIGFWRLVIASLAGAGVLGDAAGLSVSAYEIDDVLPCLVEALDAQPAPVVLVLDDLHAIADPAIFADLERLLRMPPACLRLLVTTRFAPPMRLQRLRLASQLTDIGVEQLAFTRAETATAVAAAGVTLSETDVTTLFQRTEGWPAGVALTVRCLVDRADPGAFVATLEGTEGPVADYLVEEVVGALPGHIAGFLVETSIVERINGDLADAITSSAGSAAILDAISRDGLQRREWFRSTACCAASWPAASSATRPRSSLRSTRAPPTGSPTAATTSTRSGTRSGPRTGSACGCCSPRAGWR